MSDVLGPFQFHLKNVLDHEFNNDIQNSSSLHHRIGDWFENTK